MTESHRERSAGAERRAAQLGTAMSTIWLVFLVFPIWSLWIDEETLGEKVLGTLVVSVFVVFYVHGFWRWTDQLGDRATADCSAVDQPESVFARAGSTGHLVALGSLSVLSLGLNGIGMLGLLPFVVSFAIFTARWTVSIPILVVAIVVALGLPAQAGSLDAAWFFALIIGAVGGACVLIRVSEEHQLEQAQLRSEVALGEERSRVARDVHDVLGHSLTAVTLKAELSERLLQGTEGNPPSSEAIERARTELAELQTITRGAISEIRSTVGGLRTVALADELAAARSVLADADVKLSVIGDPADIPDDYRSAVAWVVRESVTNIVRHARASAAEIRLGSAATTGSPGGQKEVVVVRVTDDGIGFGAASEGNGLRGLRERIDAIGGELRTAGDGSGTRIEVVV